MVFHNCKNMWFTCDKCCDHRVWVTSVESFTLRQPATTEFTCHAHSVTAWSCHIQVLFLVHILFMVHTHATQHWLKVFCTNNRASFLLFFSVTMGTPRSYASLLLQHRYLIMHNYEATGVKLDVVKLIILC